MTWLAQTLWDLVKPVQRPAARIRKPVIKRRPAVAPHRSPEAAPPSRTPMQDRYDAIVIEMKQTHGLRVRKWRKSSSGVARLIRYADGRVVKLVESPYPRGPMSCAIFLHEVGHHVLGLGVHRPRCLEEYRVWVWALETMRAKGFNVTPAVERRMERSMKYAVAKALRRGLRDLPGELERYR
jgi:hypothetical protein